MVLTELILNSFYFGQGVVVLEITDFSQFSTIGQGVVVLKELIFNSFYYLGGCGGLARTTFPQFLLWEGVVVLK